MQQESSTIRDVRGSTDNNWRYVISARLYSQRYRTQRKTPFRLPLDPPSFKPLNPSLTHHPPPPFKPLNPSLTHSPRSSPSIRLSLDPHASKASVSSGLFFIREYHAVLLIYKLHWKLMLRVRGPVRCISGWSTRSLIYYIKLRVDHPRPLGSVPGSLGTHGGNLE